MTRKDIIEVDETVHLTKDVYINKWKGLNPVPFYFLAIIFLLLLLQFCKPAIYKEAQALKLVPQVECYTELYFENYNNLPRKLIKGESVSILFTVKNSEDKDMEYPYNMYIEYNGNKVPVKTGAVSVKNNESRTVQELYIPEQDYEKEVIVVELPEQNQRIHYLLADKNNN